jgi:hypothetical protein
MEIRLDQQETKNADKIKWWKGSFGPQKGELVKSTAQRFSSSAGNEQFPRQAFPVE